MNKRIVLSGYYGFDNLGDEAVLLSIIQALQNEDHDIEITVLSNNPEHTIEQYGVKAKGRWKIAEVFSALKNADLLISGGGSLLQDVTSQMTIPYYLGVVGLGRLLRKKTVFYAQGIGPIEGTLGRTLTRLIANRVQLITVRDQESRELLKELGVQKPQIEVTVDPVVLLQSKIPESAEYWDLQALKESCQKRGVPLIGIAPRPWKGLENYQNVLIETMRELQQKRGAEFFLIPMHQEVDLPFCKEMSASVQGVKVLEGRYRPDEVLAFYQQLDLLVGIRLHALIFGAVAHVPILGISYDPKIDNFLKRIDQQAFATVEELQMVPLVRELENRFNDLANERERLIKGIKQLQERGRNNAQMVLKLLETND